MSETQGAREMTAETLAARYGPRALNGTQAIDLESLVPAGQSFPADRPPPAPVGPLVRAVLDDFLADQGHYVFPGGGRVLVYQPGAPRGLADLKLRAIKAEIERRAGAELAPAPASAPPASRRLDPEAFRQVAARAGKRAVFPLDLAEILLNAPGSDEHLPRRARRVIRSVLDDYLHDNGYYAWPADSRVLLVLPRMPRGLARLKRDAIAMEVRRSVEEAFPDLRGKADSQARRDTLAGPLPAKGGRARPTPAEQKLWDQAVEAMAEKLWPGYDMASLTSLPANTECRFLPIWRVPGHMLTGYLVQVYQLDSKGTVLATDPLGGEPGSAPDPDHINRLDLPMLAQAIVSLEDMEQSGRRAVVFLPVHYQTLARPRFRRLFLEMLSRLTETTRRLLVMELVDLPTDLAVSRLDDLVRQLRPFCRAVVARVPLGRRDFRPWRSLGLHAVGADVRAFAGPEADLMKSMDGLLDAAAPFGFKTYAHGLTTRSLTVAAITSGFEYIAGPAIAPPVPAPGGVRDFQARDLYDSLATAPTPEG